MGLADLHVHTNHSFDGTAPVAAVLQEARQIGLDVIAITDHDAIDGALEAMDLAAKIGIEVIPGIEISTAEGDLLALFVTKKIERGTDVGALAEGFVSVTPLQLDLTAYHAITDYLRYLPYHQCTDRLIPIVFPCACKEIGPSN